MNLDLYFPTPVWWEDIAINNDEILNFCYDTRKKDPNGRQMSNVGGWQSQDIAPGEHTELDKLVDAIYLRTDFCLSTYGFRPGSLKMEIGNMWININGENDVNMVHIHNGSFLSGCYYVKASKDSGQITFYKNFAEDFAITSVAPIDRFTQVSGSTAKYPARAGRLVMFPSWLPHGVTPNHDDERISIAFNIKMNLC